MITGRFPGEDVSLVGGGQALRCGASDVGTAVVTQSRSGWGAI